MAAATTEPRSTGIDPRTVKPALLVLALAVVMGVLLPYIDSQVSYRNEVDEGDVVRIADRITLVPEPGWALAGGALVGHTRSPVGTTASAELVDGGVRFSVQAAPFTGTPSALLTRINEINADLANARSSAAANTDRYAVTTSQGAVGVAEDFVGVENEGTIVAFVFKSPRTAQGQPISEGVEIVVSGPMGPLSRRRDEIVQMIRSLRTAA